jgi:Sec-independent protein translocase protein TatA
MPAVVDLSVWYWVILLAVGLLLFAARDKLGELLDRGIDRFRK